MSICFAVFRREVWIEIPILRRSSRAKRGVFEGILFHFWVVVLSWLQEKLNGHPRQFVTWAFQRSASQWRLSTLWWWHDMVHPNLEILLVYSIGGWVGFLYTSEISVSWRLRHLYFLAKSWTPHFCGLSPQSWLISFFSSPITHQAFTCRPNHIAVFVHLLTMSESIPTRNQHCW